MMRPFPPLFRYLSSNGAIATLTSRKLRFAQPHAFNDPLDCAWDVLWQTAHMANLDQFVKDAAEILVAKPIDNRRFASSEPKRLFYQLRNECIHSPNPRETAEAVLRSVYLERAHASFSQRIAYIRELRQSFRILCCTHEPAALPMWSNYADKHRGCLIEIDLQQLALPKSVEHGAVEYVDEFPSVMTATQILDSFIYGTDIDESIVRRVWTRTKAKDWAFEREYRLVTSSTLGPGPHLDVDLPPKAIRKVSVGCLAPKAVATKIKDLCKGWPVPLSLYRAKLKPHGFAVVPFAEEI